jgi:predicted TIM-barrel fold metal-dependent hydrolase
VTARSVNLLPEPEAEPLFCPVVSVDDHVTEPPTVFEGRIEARFAARAPRIVEDHTGGLVWAYEDGEMHDAGLGAVAGRPQSDWRKEPIRYDEVRKGVWDIHARVRDMDLDGIAASLCFPSMCGFAGRHFAESKDPELGLACVRAYNRWYLEEWAGTYPGRIIPLQLTWPCNPGVAAAEIRANADRGFRAVTFPDLPQRLGFPAIHEAVWDPFLRACEETETVICLHTGGAGYVLNTRRDAPVQLQTTLFPAGAYVAAIEWIWAFVPLRFPRIRIALSEGGIGWVPMALDRLEYVMAHSGGSPIDTPWPDRNVSPAEVLRRNFWFCMLDDHSTLHALDRIGVDHVMFESDYPHADSTWPHTQTLLTEQLGGLDRHVVEGIAFRNASHLFRWPVDRGEPR